MKISVGPVGVELEEHGDRICAHMRQGGTFEPETLAVWGRLCVANKDRVVVDVGAYSGLFSIAAAMIGCWAHAFEPMPLNAKRIVNNAHLNGGAMLRNKIKLHRFALSDKAGMVEINYNPAVPGLTSGASLVNRDLGNRPTDTLPVETMELDALALQDVAAIKIDVERAEPNVLRGARETLKRCKPTLIVEVLGDEEERAVLDAITGYEIAKRLDTRHGRPANWLLVPTS